MTFFPSETNKLPDAIFWDWDGTIVDSYDFLNNAHNHTLRTLGMDELKEGAFRNYFGKGKKYIFADVYKNKINEAVEIFQNYVMENNHKIKPMDGIKEIMAFLQGKNVVLGLVTNKGREYVEKELGIMKLDKFLPIVVCSSEAPNDKPSPDPLLLAIKKAGMDIQKNEIWYAGDTETDLICARDAGCKSVFVKGHIDTERLLLEYSPYISFDNYSSFKDFLVAI